MSSLGIAMIVFACIFGGSAIGMAVRRALPADHLSADSRDVMKLGIGLIATMTALVLGLLTASAKGSFDLQNNEVKQSATEIVLLDRTLARYGPQTQEIRDLVRRAVIARLALTWPEHGPAPGKVEAGGTTPTIEMIEGEIRALAPADDSQRWLQSRALQISGEVMKTRWLVLGQQVGSAIPLPFLVVVVFWLAVLFGCFGLLAPRNATVVAVLGLSALSVSGAIFLILEMDQPFQGLLKISGEPLRYAVAQLGQ